MFKSIHTYFYFILVIILCISLFINYEILLHPSSNISLGTFGTILASLVSLFGITIVYLTSRKQFFQQENHNIKNIEQLKEEFNEQKKANELNQFQKQIENLFNYIDINLLNKKEFDMKYINYFLEQEGSTLIHLIKLHDSYVFEKNVNQVYAFVKGSSFDNIQWFESLFGINKTKIMIAKVSSIDTHLKLFSLKFISLIVIIKKAQKLGLDKDIIESSLLSLKTYAGIAYKYGYLQESIYINYKAIIIANHHINEELNIDFKELLLKEISINFPSLNTSKSNIDIEIKTLRENNDLKLEFIVFLKDLNINLKRYESGEWEQMKTECD